MATEPLTQIAPVGMTEPDVQVLVAGDDSLTDEALMSQVMRGDSTALRPLIDRYYQPMLAYAFRMCGGDRALAEDATQETYMKLMTQHSYSPKRPFRPWLYRVATSCAYDRIRHAQEIILPEEKKSLDRFPGTEESVLAGEQVDTIRDAVTSLPWEYRSVIVLRYYHDLSLNEIAEALTIPLGTVKSRTHEAIRRLRQSGQMTEARS